MSWYAIYNSYFKVLILRSRHIIVKDEILNKNSILNFKTLKFLPFVYQEVLTMKLEIVMLA